MDFSAGGLFVNLLFSAIGFVGFMYGKRTQQPRAMGVGAALMIYPYFVSGVLLMTLVGAALTGLLFYWRD